jgi:hypothetical protein
MKVKILKIIARYCVFIVLSLTETTKIRAQLKF